MMLPASHPLRVRLNDEVHARPPEALDAPCRVSYIAMACDAAQAEASLQAVATLAKGCGVRPPDPGATHYSADLYSFRLRWERHTEFVRYSFIVPGADDVPFARTALSDVPADWVAAMPGALMVAAHLALVANDGSDPADLGGLAFAREGLVGSLLSDGAGAAFTDFRIHPDGFSRILVRDQGMTRWEAGRVCQRLLEIDTYRLMALLALPVAQGASPELARGEQELARITAAMVAASEADDPELLDRLTRLAAAVDSRLADTLYRFSAAAAYEGIVYSRIAELREKRLAGLQTMQEFIERRLAPAMNTCRSISARQEELSRRVSRATQLLATRVGVMRERQSQEQLSAMNRRVRIQLRLQSTVEGLSVAAVTYYVSALVGRIAEGLHLAGVAVRPGIAEAVSVPFVAVLVWLGVRRVHRMVAREE